MKLDLVKYFTQTPAQRFAEKWNSEERRLKVIVGISIPVLYGLMVIFALVLSN